MSRVCPLVLGVALVAACGARKAAPPAPIEPVSAEARPGEPPAVTNYWVPGERMMWHLSFRGISLVRAMTAVGEPGALDGRRILIVRSRLEGMGLVSAYGEVRVEMQSWIDLARGRPVRYDWSAKVLDERTKGSIVIGPGRLDRTFQKNDREPYQSVRHLPEAEHVHDVHTVLGFLRGWTGKEGDLAELVHFDDTQLRRHVVRISRFELFDGPLGKTPAVRIDGVVTRNRHTTRGKPYVMWISDDARRQPLRIEVPTKHGPIRLDLVEYDDPRS